MRERRPRESFLPSPLRRAPRRSYEPVPACARPATTSFHFFSSDPSSDCRHSWLPSHRLSSCFPFLRLRFVALLRALCLSALSPAFSLSLSLSLPLPLFLLPFPLRVGRRLSSSIRSRRTHCQSFIGGRRTCFVTRISVSLPLIPFSGIQLLPRVSSDEKEPRSWSGRERERESVRRIGNPTRARLLQWCNPVDDFDEDVGVHGSPSVS